MFFFGQFVRFNERVPVGRHGTVGLAPAVQRIDADPCAAAGPVGPDDRVDVVFFAQAGDELRRLHGQVGIDGPELAVAVGRRLRDEPDQVAGAEQRLQIADQHLAGRKFHSILKIGEGGDPAVLSRHGADGAQGHGMLRALERGPATFAVALHIALIVFRHSSHTEHSYPASLSAMPTPSHSA